MKKNSICILILFAIFSLPNVAYAGAELNKGDTAWLLISTALVLFMTLPGLALFYGGLVRKENVLSILIQCFVIACVASVVWFVYGYSLAFKGDGAWLGNLEGLFLAHLTRESLYNQIPETVWIMFQMTFAIITPALVIGAFAERMKFISVILFTILWLTLVYVPVAHWVWGGGWLSKLGTLDYAGGLVVHLTCGIGALVSALMIGNRNSFPQTAPPHNRTMVFTGAAMLWVGWFGFNAGSAVSANQDAGMAMLVTHLSASVGALTWLTIDWIKSGKPTIIGIATGMVAGLATITPASGYVGPAGSILIGLFAGVVCYFATDLIKNKWQLDDSLDVFPVHGVGGLLGSIMVAGLISTSWGGIGFSNDHTMGSQLWVQLQAIAVILVWTLSFTFIILKLINVTVGLRVKTESEAQGLDVADHDEQGYII